MNGYMRLIWRNTKRNPRRLFLTTTSVAISMFIVCTLITIVVAVEHFMNKGGFDKVIGVAERYGNGRTPMPETHLNAVRQIPGVAAALGASFGRGTYRDATDLIGLWAVDAPSVRLVFGGTLGFDEISAQEFRNFEDGRTAALVGKAWASRYGWKLGDRIAIKASFPGHVDFDLTLVVAGVIAHGFHDSRILFHREYLEEITQRKGVVDLILLTVQDVSQTEPVSNQIRAAFLNSSVPVTTLTSAAFFNRFLAGLNLKTIIATLCVVVVLASISITGNSIAMSARERRREVAILKTLGFRTRDLMGLLLGEAVLVALVGGVLGSVASFLLFSGAGFVVRVGPLSYFEASPAVVALGVLMSFTIGALSGAIPTLSACRAPIARSLREVF